MRRTRDQRDAEARNAAVDRPVLRGHHAGTMLMDDLGRRRRRTGQVFDHTSMDGYALATAMPALLGHLAPQNARIDPAGYAMPDRPYDPSDDQ